jgi:hypothetical protein
MQGPINVKSPNNITKWQMRFNSAFKVLIFGSAPYFSMTMDFIFSCGHWVLGTRTGQLRYQFWFPNFRDTAKGRLFGHFNASKRANYVVPKSSRLNTQWNNVRSLKDWPFVHICGNLNTLGIQLHYKLSQIILSTDTKQNIQLIEFLLILKNNQILVCSLLYGMWTSLSAVSSSVSKPEPTASFSHWNLLATCSEGDRHVSICGLFPVLLTTQCPSVGEVPHFSFHPLIITGRLHQSPLRSPELLASQLSYWTSSPLHELYAQLRTGGKEGRFKATN